MTFANAHSIGVRVTKFMQSLEGKKMANLDNLKGIKLAELMKLGNCVVCGKKQLEGGIPLFYCVTISRAGFDHGALQRAAGLEMMLGPIASAFSPDADLAKVIDGPHNVFVHETCADKIGHLLQLIPEIKAEEAVAEADVA